MLRLRSAAGQVAAEYLGGLLLVAVVIAALIGSQVHTHCSLISAGKSCAGRSGERQRRLVRKRVPVGSQGQARFLDTRPFLQAACHRMPPLAPLC